jgi:hydroxymethylbilane synthase
MADSSTAQPEMRLGTRASILARWQAEWVAGRLTQLGQAVEVVEITTQGDVEQRGPIADIGSPGVFTKSIQRALVAGEVDLAVHSLKDLPTEPVAGIVLAAVPVRESSADVLIARAANSFEALPRGARIGTGSLRRQAQLRHARPDVQVEAIRGNVETRLAKLEHDDGGHFDAVVLAEAGLKRLGLVERITQVLPWAIMLPAVGQGALGIECRDDDSATRQSLAKLDDPTTHAAVRAERSLLAHLRGGCLAPIGAYAHTNGDELRLSAVVLSPDGSQRLYEEATTSQGEDAESLGRRVADRLLSRGAAKLIATART